jgi:hypothetical protein
MTKKIFLIMLMIISITFTTTSHSMTIFNQNPTEIQAIYSWGRPNINILIKQIELIDNNRINTIYLDLEAYQYDKQNEISNLSEVNKIVLIANKKNINIHGLIGAPMFYEKGENKIVYDTLDFIKKYNSMYVANIISGIHLNIEFYNNKGFKENAMKYSNEYVEFMYIFSQRIREYQRIFNGFNLSSTLSHFSDIPNDYIPFVTFQGKLASVFEHNARIFNLVKNSSLVIMAYRSTITGPNSVTDIVNNEFRLLNRLNTKIVIALETNDIGDTKLSFNNQTKNSLFNSIDSMKNYYLSMKGYGGYAVHDIKGLLNLK